MSSKRTNLEELKWRKVILSNVDVTDDTSFSIHFGQALTSLALIDLNKVEVQKKHLRIADALNVNINTLIRWSFKLNLPAVGMRTDIINYMLTLVDELILEEIKKETT